MKYEVRFPSGSIEGKFYKVISKITQANIRAEIMEEVEKLSANPRPYGIKPFKKLKPPIQFYQFTAQYRIRIGDYRVLYDVDDEKRMVWILALRKRSEGTYRH